MPQYTLRNGEPQSVLWWTGLLREPVPVPANLTRGLSIIINPLVRLPWQFPNDERPAWARDPMLLNQRMQGGGGVVASRPFLDRLSRFDFWSRWLRDAVFFGIGLFSYERLDDGQPRAGSLLLHDPRGLFEPVEGTGQDWRILWRGTDWPVSEEGDILGTGRRLHFIRGHHGGLVGMHARELLLANNVIDYSNETFDTGTPSGVLTSDQPINQTQADQIRTRWEEQITRRRLAVLGNGAQYQQVVMSPMDAQLAEMSRMSNTKVAHMLELAAFELDGDTGGSMTYANVVDRRQDRVDGTLAGWSARVEESISALLPWGQTMTIDFSKYRMPTSTQEAVNAPAEP